MALSLDFAQQIRSGGPLSNGFVAQQFESWQATLAPVLSTVTSLQSTVNALTPSVVTRLIPTMRNSDTSVGATDVISVPISGLQRTDVLEIRYTIQSATQQTARVDVYNSTDGVVIAQLTSAAAILPNVKISGSVQISNLPFQDVGVAGITTAFDSTGVSQSAGVFTSTTQLWAQGWNLTVRHQGVSVGGIFSYTIGIFKIAGS